MSGIVYSCAKIVRETDRFLFGKIQGPHPKGRKKFYSSGGLCEFASVHAFDTELFNLERWSF